MLATRRSALAAALAATIGVPGRGDAGSARSGEHKAEGSDEAAKERQAEERQVLVKGVPVHYESRGSGRAVVMVHGFTLDRRSLVGCMEPVFAARAGWRRIYFDLPGMGRTPGSGAIASSDDMLDVVLSFIDAVIPGQRFSIVGQSYGGYLARGVLARKAASIDGMALICPVVVAERAKRELPQHSVVAKDEALLASLSGADADAFASNFVVQNRLTWLGAFRRSCCCRASDARIKRFWKALRVAMRFLLILMRLPGRFRVRCWCWLAARTVTWGTAISGRWRKNFRV